MQLQNIFLRVHTFRIHKPKSCEKNSQMDRHVNFFENPIQMTLKIYFFSVYSSRAKTLINDNSQKEGKKKVF